MSAVFNYFIWVGITMVVLPKAIRGQCKDVDQPTAALIADLRQRGSLGRYTLIVWGGEFGRTIYSQGKLSDTSYGRDHHPRCFTIFMAGAGGKKDFPMGQRMTIATT